MSQLLCLSQRHSGQVEDILQGEIIFFGTQLLRFSWREMEVLEIIQRKKIKVIEIFKGKFELKNKDNLGLE